MVKVLFIVFVALSSCLTAQAPGTYTGTWASGGSGGNGKLSLTFTGSELSAASFTLQGQQIKTKPVSLKANGANLDFAFEYDLDGNQLRSRMQGNAEGKTIKGKYQSVPAGGGAPVDEGTWEVTQQ